MEIKEVTLTPNPALTGAAVTISVVVDPAPVILVTMDGLELVTMDGSFITAIGE